MNFKKSYVLLISLISLFLLLGMSTVSAASDADMMAQDSAIDDIIELGDIDGNAKDVEALSQGEETFISDEAPETGDDGGEGGDDPVDDSIDTSIEANDTEYTYGDTIKINFSLMDNESNPINNTNESNFKVFYKNLTEEDFNHTVGFSINNESQLVLDRLGVGKYSLKIQFLNSTIGDKNYTESYTIIDLNITITNSTINASVAKVKIDDDVIIPFKIYIGPKTTLNVDVTRLKVTCNGEEYGFTNITGGDNVTNGIKITNFTKEVGIYSIFIAYIGNNNCNPSNTTIILHILENNTISIGDNLSVDFENHNITVPISIYNNDNILSLDKENITLELVYYNGTEHITEILDISDFDFSGEDGNYTISFVKDVPLNDAKLTIIYANNTLDETNVTLSFIMKNTIDSNDTIKFNNHSKNVTISIIINHTSMVMYDVKNITNKTVLNLTSGDIILVLTYKNGTENLTVEITNDKFELDGENGKYNISFILNEIIQSEEPISFDNATVTIFYANATLNETNKTVNLKEIIELTIVPVNVIADYQDGEFIFNVTDSVTGEPISNTNITVGGLWFYTFGDTKSLSGSKVYSTDENGLLRIKNENMNPSWDIAGYNSGFVALPVGEYNLTFSASAPLVLDNKFKITVNKVQAKIIAKDLTGEYGNVLKYTFQLVNAATNNPIKLSNVQFMIKASNIDAVRDGATNLTGWYISPDLNLTGGSYNLTLKSTDSNLICSAAKATLTLKPRTATLTASNRTIYYNSGYTAIVKLKDKKTGKVVANAYVWLRVYTSSSKYTDFIAMTNKNGQVYLTTPLSVGKHKIIYQTIDNNYKASKITRYLTVKTASAKFTAPKVSTYYKSGRVFKVKLINTKNKKPIHNAKMNIKIFISKNKYYNYTGVTDGNGLVQFKANLKPGTYKVKISDYDKGYTAKAITSQIKVSKSPIKIAPTALKVKKGKYFKVKVTSTKSKKVLSAVKVKVRVYTGKKFKTYTIKTNKKGIASLKITQKVGKHKVVLTPYQTKYYSAKKVTKTLKVVK